jgi:hypothetical protein
MQFAVDELKVVELQPGVVELYVPITFMLSPAGETAQAMRFLMNQSVGEDSERLEGFDPIPAPQP